MRRWLSVLMACLFATSALAARPTTNENTVILFEDLGISTYPSAACTTAQGLMKGATIVVVGLQNGGTNANEIATRQCIQNFGAKAYHYTQFYWYPEAIKMDTSGNWITDPNHITYQGVDMAAHHDYAFCNSGTTPLIGRTIYQSSQDNGDGDDALQMNGAAKWYMIDLNNQAARTDAESYLTTIATTWGYDGIFLDRGGAAFTTDNATLGGLWYAKSTCTTSNGDSAVTAGYSSAPSVTFTGGGCSVEPTGTAVLGTDVAHAGTQGYIPTQHDGVASVTMNTAGSGCTSLPTVTFSTDGGTGGLSATGTAVSNGSGGVASVTITSSDYRYTFSDAYKGVATAAHTRGLEVTLNLGRSGVDHSATQSAPRLRPDPYDPNCPAKTWGSCGRKTDIFGVITTMLHENNSRWDVRNNCTVAGGNCDEAALLANWQADENANAADETDGTYGGMTIEYSHDPYGVDPSSSTNVTEPIPNPSGTPYTPTGSVPGVVNLYGGSGYSSAPTPTFSGGGYSTNATATDTISGGVVNTFTMTNDGAGYTSVPSLSFSGSGGAFATPVVVGSSVTDATRKARAFFRWTRGKLHAAPMAYNSGSSGCSGAGQGTACYSLGPVAGTSGSWDDLNTAYLGAAIDTGPTSVSCASGSTERCVWYRRYTWGIVVVNPTNVTRSSGQIATGVGACRYIKDVNTGTALSSDTCLNNFPSTSFAAYTGDVYLYNDVAW